MTWNVDDDEAAALLRQAREQSARLNAAEPSAARRMFSTIAWTPDSMLEIARAFIDDPLIGDVPEDVRYSFAMTLGGSEHDRVLGAIDTMRREHFARLGKPVPADPGNFPR
jgi:hypothetical protein